MCIDDGHAPPQPLTPPICGKGYALQSFKLDQLDLPEWVWRRGSAQGVVDGKLISLKSLTSCSRVFEARQYFMHDPVWASLSYCHLSESSAHGLILVSKAHGRSAFRWRFHHWSHSCGL